MQRWKQTMIKNSDQIFVLKPLNNVSDIFTDFLYWFGDHQQQFKKDDSSLSKNTRINGRQKTINSEDFLYQCKV